MSEIVSLYNPFFIFLKCNTKLIWWCTINYWYVMAQISSTSHGYNNGKTVMMSWDGNTWDGNTMLAFCKEKPPATMDSPSKGSVVRSFGVVFVVGLNRLLNTLSNWLLRRHHAHATSLPWLGRLNPQQTLCGWNTGSMSWICKHLRVDLFTNEVIVKDTAKFTGI